MSAWCAGAVICPITRSQLLDGAEERGGVDDDALPGWDERDLNVRGELLDRLELDKSGAQAFADQAVRVGLTLGADDVGVRLTAGGGNHLLRFELLLLDALLFAQSVLGRYLLLLDRVLEALGEADVVDEQVVYVNAVLLQFEDKPLAAGRLVQPVAEYSHSDGCSVTGGYVYRGPAIPELSGRYVYGDYCSGRIWSIPASGADRTPRVEDVEVPSLVSFGEDLAGRLYAVSHGGTVYRFTGS